MHFAYVGTDDGDRWNAYLAGPAWWGWCHKSTRTKPCLDLLTNGALECPRCLAGKEPLMTGYVPVYRQADGAPRSVIVAEVSREVIDSIKLHTRVLIGREMDAKFLRHGGVTRTPAAQICLEVVPDWLMHNSSLIHPPTGAVKITASLATDRNVRLLI